MFQDEETGAWYQHKGRDFKVPLVDDVPDNGNLIGAKKSFGKWLVILYLSMWNTFNARYLQLLSGLQILHLYS